jgi:intracellular sulfur oxidation DsrE/DsrF family protein
MKSFFVLIAVACLGLLSARAEEPVAMTSQPLMGPVIQDFGPYMPIVNPGFATPLEQSLRAVFDVSKSKEPGELNRHLETPARFLNMHGGAGVKPEMMHAVIVVHGPATRDLLNDEAYEKRFGSPNPNHALLDALSGAGVEVVLCGQSMAFGGYQQSEFLPQVKVALSAMTALVSFQERGYRLIAF